VRFFHDHRLFCLREHKYTAVGRRPCARTVGAGCYACLGFVSRSSAFPGVELRSVSSLLAEQRREKGASSFVVASRDMAGEVIGHGFDPARVHVLPLYAERDDAPPTPRAADQLLYVGALTRGKGLDVLLEALARARTAPRLAVVGSGPQEAEWRALSAALGLEGRVEFVGASGRAELAGRFRRATCLVMPVRAPETFGLVGVEAMSHGTPVIASDLGGVREWLEHGRTGLGVAPGSVDELTAAIDAVLGHPARAAAMGRAAREAHQRRFLPEHHVEPLLSLFATVARGRA
jgi:glycosyltransferase involved in cell wall biosynthesis